MPPLRTTHTNAVLEVTEAAYEEIASKLREAGYHHAFDRDGLIDMNNIALQRVRHEVAGQCSNCEHARFHHDRTRLGYRRCWIYLCPCAKYEPVPHVETP